jgi:hypothetical protein
VTVEAQEYMHEFAVPHCSLWQYRSPGDWLQDLWQASTGPEGETELCVNWAQDTEVAGVGAVWSIHCTGSERALRWVCVALNQHAEQSPGDLTPPEQAERLELVLAGQRFVLVAEGIRTNDGRLVVGRRAARPGRASSPGRRDPQGEAPVPIDARRALRGRGLRAVGRPEREH